MENIIRSDKQKGNFTSISNEILQSKKLTQDEKGLLVYLLSLPTSWNIKKTEIWREINISRKHFEDAWNGLCVYGYIQSFHIIDKITKKAIGWRHIVFEIPENQLTENREVGNTIEIPINRKPTHRNPVNRNSVNLINNKEKKKLEKESEDPKGPDKKIKIEKELENAGGSNTGPEGNLETYSNDTPSFFSFQNSQEDQEMITKNEVQKKLCDSIINLRCFSGVKEFLIQMVQENGMEILPEAIDAITEEYQFSDFDKREYQQMLENFKKLLPQKTSIQEPNKELPTVGAPITEPEKISKIEPSLTPAPKTVPEEKDSNRTNDYLFYNLPAAIKRQVNTEYYRIPKDQRPSIMEFYPSWDGKR